MFLYFYFLNNTSSTVFLKKPSVLSKNHMTCLTYQKINIISYLNILNKVVFFILSRKLLFSLTSTSMVSFSSVSIAPFSETDLVLMAAMFVPCDRCRSWQDWYSLTSYTALSVWQYRSSADIEIFPSGEVVLACWESGASFCNSSFCSSTSTSKSFCLK